MLRELLLTAAILMTGCAVTDVPTASAGADLTADAGTEDPARGFTADFRAFLAGTRWAGLDFARTDLAGPSAYGGRRTAGEALVHDPVVFVHGNSDRGLGGDYGGYATSIAAFEAAGYGPGELYTFTWGPANKDLASLQYHSRAYLTRVRAFLEAVLAYTGAAHIDVVGHSMGVTLARKAIAGGVADDLLAGGPYDLGASLGDRVDAFVGISGANLGLETCFAAVAVAPTCGATNGFFPGVQSPYGSVGARSAFLEQLLAHPHAEGSFVAAMWSPGDTLLGPLVYGAPTARLPGSDAEIVLDASCDHFASKTETSALQIALVRDHDASGPVPRCAP